MTIILGHRDFSWSIAVDKVGPVHQLPFLHLFVPGLLAEGIYVRHLLPVDELGYLKLRYHGVIADDIQISQFCVDRDRQNFMGGDLLG